MPSAFILVLLVAASTAFGADCDGLSKRSLPATTIDKVETVAAGAFTRPRLNPEQQAVYQKLPAFCRVAATVRPTSCEPRA